MWTIAAALIAQAVAGHALEPSGPWQLDETELGCAVTRPFAPSGMTIGFQVGAGVRYPMLLIAGPSNTLPSPGEDASIRADPGTQALSIYFMSGRAFKSDERFRHGILDAASYPAVRDADYLTIGRNTLHLPGKVGALKAAKDCAAKLLKVWGVDPTPFIEDQLAEPAGSLAEPFGPGAYPLEAAKRGVQGRVVALLLIGPEGRVSGCGIVQSTSPLLNDGTCKVALRIPFKPLPVGQRSSYFILPVEWTLPGQGR